MKKLMVARSVVSIVTTLSGDCIDVACSPVRASRVGAIFFFLVSTQFQIVQQLVTLHGPVIKWSLL
jgi:hypothetical protein